MGINKVVYGNTTLIDLTDSTLASADQLSQGVTAYDRTGTKITGTATGGGTGGAVYQDEDGYLILDDDASNAFSDAIETLPNGGLHHIISGVVASGGGLEYETGTWTPSEDAALPTVEFSNTHSKSPMIVVINDTTDYSTAPRLDSVIVWTFYDTWQATGGSFPSPGYNNFAYMEYYYRASSGGGSGGGRTQFSHNSSEEGQSSSYPSYYVTTSYFRPYGTSSRIFLSDRTYKWIAVWAPTT